MKQQIQSIVKSALSELSFPEVIVPVVPTQDPAHGDYATNVAFSLSKELKKSPLEIADLIIQNLKLKTRDQFDKVEVAGNGFINFTLSNKALLESLSIEQKNAGSASHKGGKVMIEFTDPNPFKEFHIGHLYSNIVGESIARLMESTGAQVRRVNYQGDVGLHVAKAVWGAQRLLESENVSLEEVGAKSPQERAQFLGKGYALGATAFEEDPSSKEEIIDINKKVYAKDPSVMELYSSGRQWSLDYFDTIYERLGTEFTKMYFESEAGPIGAKIVGEHKDIFKESDGAIIFPGEEHGLHTRVFINSLGLPTYEAKELGLAVTKYKDYCFDQSIIITGNEINEYFKVLLKALSLIEPEIADKMRHLSHGMVRLPEGKMSSRTGNVVTGEWLLDEAVKRAREKIDESKVSKGSTPEKNISLGVEPLNNEETLQVAEIVGVGAVKWALLKSSIGKDIEFSFDESISFEGNSGPYIQYTFVRTQSVLTKSQVLSPKSQVNELRTNDYRLEPAERDLLVLLTRYNDIISEAADKFAPHLVTTYLFELSQSFNNFYQKHPILKATSGVQPSKESSLQGLNPQDDTIRAFRLTLTAKVGETIRNGLYLLGIKTPERM